MSTGHTVVRRAVEVDNRGGRYVWGAKGPTNFDCSGFTREAARLAGASLVHGAQPQRDQLRRAGRLISVDQAMRTPGALLFRIDERAGNDHVAISLGNGSTIEAHSSKHGIGVFSAQGRRWTHGGLIPGINYSARPPAQQPPPATPNQWEILRAGIVAAKQQVLRRGARGDAVKFLQAGINNVSGRGLTVDGDFGPATEKAVRDLQAWCGLTVDGICGPRTWNLLFPGI